MWFKDAEIGGKTQLIWPFFNQMETIVSSEAYFLHPFYSRLSNWHNWDKVWIYVHLLSVSIWLLKTVSLTLFLC